LDRSVSQARQMQIETFDSTPPYLQGREVREAGERERRQVIRRCGYFVEQYRVDLRA